MLLLPRQLFEKLNQSFHGFFLHFRQKEVSNKLLDNREVLGRLGMANKRKRCSFGGTIFGRSTHVVSLFDIGQLPRTNLLFFLQSPHQIKLIIEFLQMNRIEDIHIISAASFYKVADNFDILSMELFETHLHIVHHLVHVALKVDPEFDKF